jgi:hypothetical protein
MLSDGPTPRDGEGSGVGTRNIPVRSTVRRSRTIAGTVPIIDLQSIALRAGTLRSAQGDVQGGGVGGALTDVCVGPTFASSHSPFAGQHSVGRHHHYYDGT